MPRQNVFAVRPGSILRAWDTTWKVLENDTLDQTLLLGEIENLGHRKLVRYRAGQEIFVRWSPHNTRHE